MELISYLSFSTDTKFNMMYKHVFLQVKCVNTRSQVSTLQKLGSLKKCQNDYLNQEVSDKNQK